MNIFELNRNDLLTVLREYVTALDELESAIAEKNRAQARVNFPVVKNGISLLSLALNILSIVLVVWSFSVGFSLFGGIAYAISRDIGLVFVFGSIGALLLGSGCIFLRKKLIKILKNKIDGVQNKNDEAEKNNEYLRWCIEREKMCQDKVNYMYNEFSMPKVLSVSIPTKWIYNYLVDHNVSLKYAINVYNYDTSRSVPYTSQEQPESHTDDSIRKEMETQTEILRQMNNRDYLRGVR